MQKVESLVKLHQRSIQILSFFKQDLQSKKEEKKARFVFKTDGANCLALFKVIAY